MVSRGQFAAIARIWRVGGCRGKAEDRVLEATGGEVIDGNCAG